MEEFTGWYMPPCETSDCSPSTLSSENEHFTYVGCVHGGDQLLIDRLMDLTNNPPDYLIFTGDLTGSPEMEELKKRFYNYVVNRARALLDKDSTVADEILLNYIGPSPPESQISLKDGYLHLLRYQLELEDNNPEEIDHILTKFTDAEIAARIRELTSYTYYGEWAAQLSTQTREAILGTLEESARNLLIPVNHLRVAGTQILMLEGNWDHPLMTGVRYIAGDDNIDYFDTKHFFVEQGIPFVDQLLAIETTTTLHIFLPYAVLADFERLAAEEIAKIKNQVAEARRVGKPILMVGHAEPNARIHSLFLPRMTLIGERAKLIRNFGHTIAEFRPDEVIYSHQHDPIRDVHGRVVDPNYKYVLQVENDGGVVSLVEDPGQIGKRTDQSVVTYLPLHSLAHLQVPSQGSCNLFNNDRLPVMLDL